MNNGGMMTKAEAFVLYVMGVGLGAAFGWVLCRLKHTGDEHEQSVRNQFYDLGKTIGYLDGKREAKKEQENTEKEVKEDESD